MEDLQNNSSIKMLEQNHIFQWSPHEIIQFNNSLNLSLDKCLTRVLKESEKRSNKSIFKEAGTITKVRSACIKCSKVLSFWTWEVSIHITNEEYKNIMNKAKLIENDLVDKGEELLLYLANSCNSNGHEIISIILKAFNTLKEESIQLQSSLNKNYKEINEYKINSESEIKSLKEQIFKMSLQIDKISDDLNKSNDQLKFFKSKIFGKFLQIEWQINFLYSAHILYFYLF